MKRYFKEVRMLDRGKISIQEFIRETGGTPDNWADWQACWWIYKEDGGKRISFEEWFRDAPKSPIPYEDKRTPL